MVKSLHEQLTSVGLGGRTSKRLQVLVGVTVCQERRVTGSGDQGDIFGLSISLWQFRASSTSRHG